MPKINLSALKTKIKNLKIPTIKDIKLPSITLHHLQIIPLLIFLWIMFEFFLPEMIILYKSTFPHQCSQSQTSVCTNRKKQDSDKYSQDNRKPTITPTDPENFSWRLPQDQKFHFTLYDQDSGIDINTLKLKVTMFGFEEYNYTAGSEP